MHRSRSIDPEADIHVCEREDFDPKALETVTNILDRLRRSERGGCLRRQVDWLNETLDLKPTPLTYDPSRVMENRRAMQHMTDVTKSLKMALNALQRIGDCVGRQVKICEVKAVAMRLRSGISSMPDEILAVIFECIAFRGNGSDDEFSAASISQTALILSSVCRRFRHLIVRTSSLWCCISNTMNKKFVTLLCGRITKPSAEIILNRPRGSTASEIGNFIRTIATHSQHWRRFIHGSYLMPTLFSKEDLGEVARESHGVDAPYLSELSIYHPEDMLERALRDDDAAFYYSTWKTPRLTLFKITNLVPVPFAGAAIITSFTVRLSFSRTEEHVSRTFAALIRFLKSCANLKALTLELLFTITLVELPTSDLSEFPSVQALDLSFVACGGSPVKAFLDATRFPNASSMKLRVASHQVSVQEALNVVLRSPDDFPSLETLWVTVDYALGRGHPVYIPFPALSRIRHLTLETRETYMGKISLGVHEGPFLPALRSITFSDCRRLERSWVSVILARLKAQGDMPQLVVTDCLWRNVREGGSSRFSTSSAGSSDVPDSDADDTSDESDNSVVESSSEDESSIGEGGHDLGLSTGREKLEPESTIATAEEMLSLVA